MALTPAFTPDMVLTPGTSQPIRDNVGHLGAYIPESCAPVPPAPCGGNVEIGDLLATLTMPYVAPTYGNNYTSLAPSGTGMYGASQTSYVPVPATGAAVATKGYNGIMAGLGGAAAAMAML